MFVSAKGTSWFKGALTCTNCLALIYLIFSIVVLTYSATPNNVNWGLCVEGDYLWAYVFYFSAVNSIAIVMFDVMQYVDTDPDEVEEYPTVYEQLKDSLKSPCSLIYSYCGTALLVWAFMLYFNLDKPCADRYAVRHPWLLFFFYLDVWFQFAVFLYTCFMYFVFAPVIGLTVYSILASKPKQDGGGNGSDAAAASEEKQPLTSEDGEKGDDQA